MEKLDKLIADRKTQVVRQCSGDKELAEKVRQFSIENKEAYMLIMSFFF